MKHPGDVPPLHRGHLVSLQSSQHEQGAMSCLAERPWQSGLLRGQD